jgi:hypothetical protein
LTIGNTILISGLAANAAIELYTSGFSKRSLVEGPCDLSGKRYVYVWVDGIYVQARLEDDAQCLLVIIGAAADGKKELVGACRRHPREAQSWKELLLDLKRRGLTIDPQRAVADGALGDR